MKMAREDLLRIRSIAAGHGCELTPDQLIELLKIVRPKLTITDESGLLTLVKKYGDNRTS